MAQATDKRSFGPGFQNSTSRLFRAEYALISLAIIGYLVWSYHSGIEWRNLAILVFIAAFPDIAAFIPIGIGTSKNSDKGAWPKWGADIYNLFHTILLWALVFGSVWLLLRTPFCHCWDGYFTSRWTDQLDTP
jgi:hypothetical protein